LCTRKVAFCLLSTSFGCSNPRVYCKSFKTLYQSQLLDRDAVRKEWIVLDITFFKSSQKFKLPQIGAEIGAVFLNVFQA
ncbi:hypothetical protein BGW80DRAFT_1342184, partial [Lactifluus volemus]